MLYFSKRDYGSVWELPAVNRRREATLMRGNSNILMYEMFTGRAKRKSQAYKTRG